jgi:ankyrin repeat protein
MIVLLNNVNPQTTDNYDGFSALMIAAQKRPELVLLLLDSGADPALKSRRGQTALTVARQSKQLRPSLCSKSLSKSAAGQTKYANR